MAPAAGQSAEGRPGGSERWSSSRGESDYLGAICGSAQIPIGSPSYLKLWGIQCTTQRVDMDILEVVATGPWRAGEGHNTIGYEPNAIDLGDPPEE